MDERSVELCLAPRSLLDFLPRQRWFRGKARTLTAARLLDLGRLDRRSYLAVVEVVFGDGESDRYAFAVADGEATDGLLDDATCRALLGLLLAGERLAMRRGRIEATVIAPRRRATARTEVRRIAPDQSNTSIVFGSEYILKLFRRLEDGMNPDVEMGRFLTERGFSRVPSLVAAADYLDERGSRSSILMLQDFVPNQGNAWELTLKTLESDLTRGSAAPWYLAFADRLGRRTGELHAVLASDPGDPDFAPEPYTRADLRDLAAQMRTFGEHQLRMLRSSIERLQPEARDLAAEVLHAAPDLLDRFDALDEVSDAGVRIRCHGDYHLGQTLVTDGDITILDFEGEPARPLVERRAKSSPLRDVAGMLRSFSYAAAAGLKRARRDDAQAAAVRWEHSVRAAFMDGYAAGASDAHVLPPRARDLQAVLAAFVLDKALYEVGYELNNRPDWIATPLEALKEVGQRRTPRLMSSRSHAGTSRSTERSQSRRR